MSKEIHSAIWIEGKPYAFVFIPVSRTIIHTPITVPGPVANGMSQVGNLVYACQPALLPPCKRKNLPGGRVKSSVTHS